MLIVIERRRPKRAVLDRDQGEASRGLASPSTRMDGYVLATDLLPTIFGRYGLDVPGAVTGREIETSEGATAAVAAREAPRSISGQARPVLASASWSGSA